MRVFIVHSSEDHDFVLPLAEKLKNDSIDVWIDDWKLKVGDSIVDKINKGLEESSFFIIVFSDNSLHSDWVKRELSSTLMRQLSRDKNIKILPILLDIKPEDLPPLFSDIYSAKFSKSFFDEIQYRKLIEPIKENTKAEDMERYQEGFFDNIEHIDIILKKQKPTRQEIDFILSLIKTPSYGNYFFKNCSSVYWFDILKLNEFFKPSEDIKPKEAEEKGYFYIPQWNVLPYLEKISQQVKEPGNERYIDELLAIIQDVSKYAKDNQIDNFRTWWYFVKILTNIPPKRIRTDIIDLMPIWLDSKFDTFLVGADILNKLLPKFLEDISTEEDIEKAEKIIEYVTAVKPTGDKIGAYKTKIDPHWLFEAFKKCAKPIGEKCSKHIICKLAESIEPLLKIKESKIPFTIDGNTYLLTLREDETNYVITLLKIEDKTEMDVAGKIFLKQEIKGNEIYNYSIKKRCDKNLFIRKLHKKFSKVMKIHPDKHDILKRNIKNLFMQYHNSETYYSFYGEQDFYSKEPINVLTYILKTILIHKAIANVDETREIITNFLKKNYLFYPKMALYIIGNDTEQYGDLFWNALNDDTEDMLLDDIYFADELRHLLSNLKELKDEQKELLKQKIDRISEIEEEDEVYKASLKQKWYEALSFDSEFKMLYEKMKEITKKDAKLGPAIGPVITEWVGPGPSPLTKEEILQKDNSELADFLTEFKETDLWKGPTVRGLAETLRQTVKDKPEKFVDDLMPFLNTGYLYMYYIFWGLRDAWSNKKDFGWERLFVFIERYFEQEEFWKDELPRISERGWNPDHETVAGQISHLIKEGIRDDTWVFPERLFENAKKIVWMMFDKLAIPEKEGDYRDYVFNALNSIWGKAIEAFILFTLRIVRMNEKKGEKKEVKWDEDYRDRYETFLNKGIIEAFTWFGFYLPQFHYVDKEWAKQKINDLDKRKGEKVWEAFMKGYLYGGRVYKDIYELMRPHYKYGINYDFKDTHDEERLIQHISIGYLMGMEPINRPDDSLFRIVLDKWNYKQIREIINFFWMKRDYVTQETDDAKQTREKIIEFWIWMFTHYKDKTEEQLDKNDKLLLSDLSKLTTFLPEISDENFQWLMQVAPYVKEDFTSPFFIEYLDKLKDKGDRAKTAGHIGEIFLKMLDHFTPDYDMAHIQSIIEFLYEAGEKDKADRICNIYGSRGYEFLRGLYDKYNKEVNRLE